MGFSQGASMASMLQLLLERPHLSSMMHSCSHAPFKFSILVSGFEPRDEEKLGWFQGKYPLLKERLSINSDPMTANDGDIKENIELQIEGVQGASMHIIGRTDVIIIPGRKRNRTNGRHSVDKAP
jgi:hypothetical protein